MEIPKQPTNYIVKTKLLKKNVRSNLKTKSYRVYIFNMSPNK